MGEFLGNVLKLGSGKLIAQAITIGAIPIITRLYSPEEFGIFSLYLSITMVLFPVSNLRFSSAILLPDSNSDAFNLLAAGSLATIIFSAIVAPLCVIAIMEFGTVNESYGALLWLIIIGTALQGVTQCAQFWSLRQRRFSKMAAASVVEAVIDRSASIGLGVSAAGPIGLILGRILGPAAHLITLISRGLLPDLKRFGPSVSAGAIRRQARRYRNFPLYSTWAFLFSNGARELPVVALISMFSPSVAGAYSLGMRVMNWPMLMLGDAISKVFFQEAASHPRNRKELAALTDKVIRLLTYIFLPPMLLLVFFGPPLFAFVFGEEWELAGQFTQILSISFFSSLFYRVFSVFYDIFERQRPRLFFDILLFAARGLGIALGGIAAGPIGSAFGLLAGTIAVHSAGCLYLCTLTELSLKNFLLRLAKSTAALTPLLILMVLIAMLIDELKAPNFAALVFVFFAIQSVVLLRDHEIQKRWNMLIGRITSNKSK